MSEQQGPYKVIDVFVSSSGGRVWEVVGPTRTGGIFRADDVGSANGFCNTLNLAFLAGQRDADAGLREALEKLDNFYYCNSLGRDSARAALAKAKPEGT